ncbi:MAG: hypothetical protein E6J28_08890 [Chloroflexi bacterium]|nr:MAG: hypothetical protein E6J28_08890 [Chloroflexota bacterium]
MNSADSESLARRLLAAGYVEDTLERADVAILNTCVVRQASEDRVYSKLHELREWKTPERTIALTGEGGRRTAPSVPAPRCRGPDRRLRTLRRGARVPL